MEPSLLLLLTDFQPDLDQDDAPIGGIFLDLRAKLEKPAMLLVAAEAHDVFDAGAIIPAAVEDHDLPGRRESLDIPLHEQLGPFPIGRRRQRHDAKDARAHPFGDGLDGAALARGIAALEHDDDPRDFGLDPSLQEETLDTA